MHLQQAQAEQEEEFISNTLLKKIQALKKEKEKLAVNYEQEEEFLTNDLSRKLVQVCWHLDLKPSCFHNGQIELNMACAMPTLSLKGLLIALLF